MIYSIEEIAKIIKRNKLVVRHWIAWDELMGNKYLPTPVKIIGGKRKIRLYDESGLQIFKEFLILLQENPGLMTEYNKKHFNNRKSL